MYGRTKDDSWLEILLRLRKVIIFPYDFFLYISSMENDHPSSEKCQEDSPTSLNYFCSKYYQEGLAFSLSFLTLNGAKRWRAKHALHDQCRESNPGTAVGESGEPSSAPISALSCSFSPHSQNFPLLFCFLPPFQALSRAYSSWQNWACLLAAGKSCLQAGSCRNSLLVAFSLFMWA